ncbi:hypothetical protein GG344DRAFT_80878 [Lentinula edodes]|nr:hypothetical protein GG344DRAFT_80878 [Lentinula edodes]
MFHQLFVALFSSSFLVSMACGLAIEHRDNILSDITAGASSVLGDATSLFGDATSIAPGVFETVTSEAGSIFTIVTSEGGDAITLAESAGGQATSFAGHEFTVASNAVVGSATTSATATSTGSSNSASSLLGVAGPGWIASFAVAAGGVLVGGLMIV